MSVAIKRPRAAGFIPGARGSERRSPAWGAYLTIFGYHPDMCGRFTLTSPGEVLAEFFELVEVPEVAPRYNIAPTQPAPAVRITPEGAGRRLDVLRWGLVPAWAKDPSIGSRMINARAETVATKPSFRAAMRFRRCLVVADGFYEWQTVTGQTRKQPYYIRMSEGRPFALAGLWECWEGRDGSAVESCAIITTEANELMRPLHDRMPVILSPEDYDLWLDPAMRRSERLEPLLVPYAADDLDAYRVDTLVNKPSHDTPACIEPLDDA